MRRGRIYIIPTESTLAVPPTCLQGAWHTFAAEQVCGGCVLCVTRTSVAPGTHVGGTAVEVPAGIKLAFAGGPNRTGNARRRCTTVRCTHVSATSPQETQYTQHLFSAHCSITAACSCVSQNMHRWRASAVRFSAFWLPNPMQTRRSEVHGGLWPRLNQRQHRSSTRTPLPTNSRPATMFVVRYHIIGECICELDCCHYFCVSNISSHQWNVYFPWQFTVCRVLLWLITGAWDTFYWHDITLIPAWISNYIHYKIWDEFIYPFPNFNCATVCTVEVWEWISNCIPHFTGHGISNTGSGSS